MAHTRPKSLLALSLQIHPLLWAGEALGPLGPPAPILLSSSKCRCQAALSRAFFINHSFPPDFQCPPPHMDSQRLLRNAHVPLISFLPLSRFYMPPPPNFCSVTTSYLRGQAKATEEELPERLLCAFTGSAAHLLPAPSLLPPSQGRPLSLVRSHPFLASVF